MAFSLRVKPLLRGLVFAVGTALMVAVPTVASSQVARFALLVGANRGVDPDKTLRYAERDALRMATLLQALGGFPPAQVSLLMAPSSKRLLKALSDLNQEIRSVVRGKFKKAMVVVYFSGHADGIHLELGTEKMRFSTLRDELEQLDAEIKLLFVDSCQSGGLTSYKGGRPGPSFDLVFDDSLDANGTAILTSSAAGEKSQESGILEGSFFTHFLLSGLRGTADFDQDQRVTLSEIYQYTYSKTVAETSKTMGGTQHPTYDYRISGRGKVILTDLTRGETQLQFGPEASGTFFILKQDTGEVVAEVNKPRGTWRTVAVTGDRYIVAVRRDGRVLSKELNLMPGERVRFDSSHMEEGRQLAVVFEKGAPPSRERVLGLSLYYRLRSGALKHYAAVHQGVLGMRVDAGPISFFPRLSIGATQLQRGEFEYRILLLGGEGYLTWRFMRNSLDLFVGVGASVGYGRQWVIGHGTYGGTIFSYLGTMGLEIPFVNALAFTIFMDIGSQVFRAQEALEQNLSLRCSLGIGYHF